MIHVSIPRVTAASSVVSNIDLFCLVYFKLPISLSTLPGTVLFIEMRPAIKIPHSVALTHRRCLDLCLRHFTLILTHLITVRALLLSAQQNRKLNSLGDCIAQWSSALVIFIFLAQQMCNDVGWWPRDTVGLWSRDEVFTFYSLCTVILLYCYTVILYQCGTVALTRKRVV